MPEPPEIEVGRTVALSPEDGDADSVTIPENPLVGDIVIVEVVEALVLRGPIAVGFAVIVKSGVVDALTTNLPIMYGGE